MPYVTPTKATQAPSWTAQCPEGDPPRFMEGMMIAGLAIGADEGVYLLRG